MGEQWSLKPWLSFDDARVAVHDEELRSVAQYKEWWDRNRPQQIPKYPYNVYKKEWVTWNDFLGNDNVFDCEKKVYTPYPEAVKWCHSQRIKSQRAWLDYIRETGLPDGIPSRPDLVYRTWVSWNHWLGNKAQARIAVQQEAAATAGILIIVQHLARPGNVFDIHVAPSQSAIDKLVAETRCVVVKQFHNEVGYDWKAIVNDHAVPWWDKPDEWVVTNVHQLSFDLSNDLLFA
jgi:hypothetical protein